MILHKNLQFIKKSGKEGLIMRQDKIDIELKNGQICSFYSPTKENAKQVLEHLKKVCGETDYLLRGQEEITMTIEQEENFLTDNIENPNTIYIGGFIHNQLVATSSISPISNCERCYHRAELGISVLKDYWNIGIGTAFLPLIIRAAKAMYYTQIELEVLSDNMRAFSLYKKFGFEIYGIRKNTFHYKDGSYKSSYLMALYL